MMYIRLMNTKEYFHKTVSMFIDGVKSPYTSNSPVHIRDFSLGVSSCVNKVNNNYSWQIGDQTEPKRYLIVKNNFISFDHIVGGCAKETLLKITEYCLDGHKESQLILSKTEAKSLYNLLMQMKTLLFEQQNADLPIDRTNVFELITYKKQIGYIFEVYHKKGLYKNNNPVKIPWSDLDKFLEILDFHILFNK